MKNKLRISAEGVGRHKYDPQETAILFADVRGFSKLTNHESRTFLQYVLPVMSAALDDGVAHEANTWGDGLVAFFDSTSGALRAALSLRDGFRKFDWAAARLPRLQIRVALHAGEVYHGWDPVRRKKGKIGLEINRAARIEPVVAPNHVYVTEEFRQRCRMDGVTFHELGMVSLAKLWGDDHLYVAAWDSEEIDVHRLLRSHGDSTREWLDPESLFGRFRYSQFVRRLVICADAKRAIARYAVDAGLWRADDRVFLESGTISVYLMAELLRRGTTEQIPNVVVTNSTAVPVMVALSHVSADESEIVYPDERAHLVATRGSETPAPPPTVVTLGGMVLEHSASMLPLEFAVDGSELDALACDRVTRLWDEQRISHVFMMMTGFRVKQGPFSVSDGMRRFKKLLMWYVLNNQSCRITMVVEADKLVKVVGEAVDKALLPINGGERVWNDLRSSGRAALIVALSQNNTEADIGYIKRQLAELEALGTSAICLPTPDV